MIHRLTWLLGAVLTVHAVAAGAEFKSIDQCVVGAKVANRSNQTGKITGVSNGMCKVLIDGGSTEKVHMHWMLRPAGEASAPTDKLVNGTYKCYSLAGSTLNYMFMDVKITGPGIYQDKSGNAGKYRMNGTKIVFESGPLTKANAALLTGPKIGLNMNGGSFLNTTCSLSK
jgi:hypothetical protein